MAQIPGGVHGGDLAGAHRHQCVQEPAEEPPAEALEGLRTEAPEPEDDTLVRAVQALPPKYREVVILYYYQEWRAWEIAQRLHIPVSTVTVRLSRARGMLKEKLKGWYYDGEE